MTKTRRKRDAILVPLHCYIPWIQTMVNTIWVLTYAIGQHDQRFWSFFDLGPYCEPIKLWVLHIYIL